MSIVYKQCSKQGQLLSFSSQNFVFFRQYLVVPHTSVLMSVESCSLHCLSENSKTPRTSVTSNTHCLSENSKTHHAAVILQQESYTGKSPHPPLPPKKKTEVEPLAMGILKIHQTTGFLELKWNCEVGHADEQSGLRGNHTVHQTALSPELGKCTSPYHIVFQLN